MKTGKLLPLATLITCLSLVDCTHEPLGCRLLGMTLNNTAQKDKHIVASAQDPAPIVPFIRPDRPPQPRRQLHIRPFVDGGYGAGDGSDFKNALNGIKHGVQERLPENVDVHLYGKFEFNRETYFENWWNHGVRIIGHDARLGDNVRLIQHLYGFNNITIQDIDAPASFRDWEWTINNRPCRQDNLAFRSDHIKFRGCRFRCLGDMGFQLSTGNDHWEWSDCEFSGSESGCIYVSNYLGTAVTYKSEATLQEFKLAITEGRKPYVDMTVLSQSNHGASHILVRDCVFRNGNPHMKLKDGHGFGFQNGQDCLLQDCKFYNFGGTAIEFYVGSGMQKDCRVIRCLVDGTRARYVDANGQEHGRTDGRGIAWTGANNSQVAGRRTGCAIIDCTIRNTEGECLSLNLVDPIKVSGNRLVQPIKEVEFIKSWHIGEKPHLPSGNTFVVTNPQTARFGKMHFRVDRPDRGMVELDGSRNQVMHSE